MNTKKLQERLLLIAEAQEKINHLKVACVFTTDLGALNLLQKIVSELQQMISEHLKLSEELQLCKSFRKKKR